MGDASASGDRWNDIQANSIAIGSLTLIDQRWAGWLGERGAFVAGAHRPINPPHLKL
jgi:hypothetical protein